MISATITPKAAALFKRQIADYERKIGKTERDAMIDLGKLSAKELAIRVQPFGVSAKVGKKFEASIQSQIHRAIKNANISGGSQTHHRRTNLAETREAKCLAHSLLVDNLDDLQSNLLIDLNWQSGSQSTQESAKVLGSMLARALMARRSLESQSGFVGM